MTRTSKKMSLQVLDLPPNASIDYLSHGSILWAEGFLRPAIGQVVSVGQRNRLEHVCLGRTQKRENPLSTGQSVRPSV